MRDRRRTTAAVLAGGVALASAGFAIGSQRDDGSAGAAARSSSASGTKAHIAGRGAGPGRRGGLGLDSLADRLGVSAADLRKALDELRPTGDPKDELIAALAASLGRSEADVEKAFDELEAAHEQREQQERADFAEALAGELGLDAVDVAAALDKVRPEAPKGPPPDRLRRPRGPDAMLGGLAKELGVTRAQLRAALATVRPDLGPGRPGDHRGPGVPGRPPGPGGPHGPGAPLAADLADKLGVDAAAVTKALEDFHAARRDEFAQKLADKLGIDVDTVRQALPDHP